MFKGITQLEEKKLCGLSQRMSMLNNTTEQLWRTFMPLRKHITDMKSQELISMQVYDHTSNADTFKASTEFTKWAAVEVSDLKNLPEGLFPYVLQGGLYAVFLHKGTPEKFKITFEYIFRQWFPNSGYKLDHREHFELLPENYRPDDPEAIEEIWIPVVSKGA